MREVRVQDAVGTVLCHDITEIVRGERKGARFRKGDIIRPEDVPVLLRLGKEHIYVWEDDEDMLHENDAAEVLRELCQNEHMSASAPKEGKIELTATADGVFEINEDAFDAVNEIDDVMIAAIAQHFPVKAGMKLAGMRVIPLVIEKKIMEEVRAAAGDQPLLRILPYKKMKVGEQALYFARLKGMSATDARASLTEWFERFDIMAWWNRRLEELSKGMQQKVQFIITVVHRPALLIFDEPFSGFDPVNAEQLKREMLRLKAEGRTLIFSTHNMASVEEVCDEIALIDHSRVVLSGNVHEVRERYKEHLFEVEYVGAIALQPDPTRYTLIGAAPSGGGTAIRIRKSPTVSNAELLSSLSAQGELRAFREVLPSMNEIFIKTVNPNTAPS